MKSTSFRRPCASPGSHDDTLAAASEDLPGRTGKGAVRLINLEIFGRSGALARVAARLDELDDVTRVRVVEATRSDHAVLTATIRPRAVDTTLDEVRRLGVPETDTILTRVEVVGSLVTGTAAPTLVWADVLGTAWLNARPIARYLAFMAAAGVIGGYGVIDENSILIVGAMAVSPDLLPITAVGVGIVARRPGLAGRALLTLALGLGVAAFTATAVGFLLDRFDGLPSGFDIEVSGILGGLTEVSNETIAVALVAGVAGMLALETRASSGVGVAISVTTIPAAAYFGVATGLGELDEARGALGVLGANVAMMVIGAVATLGLQSLLVHRALDRKRRVAVRSERLSASE